jgi:hypothetical protein
VPEKLSAEYHVKFNLIAEALPSGEVRVGVGGAMDRFLTVFVKRLLRKRHQICIHVYNSTGLSGI